VPVGSTWTAAYKMSASEVCLTSIFNGNEQYEKLYSCTSGGMPVWSYTGCTDNTCSSCTNGVSVMGFVQSDRAPQAMQCVGYDGYIAPRFMSDPVASAQFAHSSVQFTWFNTSTGSPTSIWPSHSATCDATQIAGGASGAWIGNAPQEVHAHASCQLPVPVGSTWTSGWKMSESEMCLTSIFNGNTQHELVYSCHNGDNMPVWGYTSCSDNTCSSCTTGVSVMDFAVADRQPVAMQCTGYDGFVGPRFMADPVASAPFAGSSVQFTWFNTTSGNSLSIFPGHSVTCDPSRMPGGASVATSPLPQPPPPMAPPPAPPSTCGDIKAAYQSSACCEASDAVPTTYLVTGA